MVVGDPDQFAVIYDTVFNWNYNLTVQYGTLFLAINSEIFPKEIQTASLAHEIPALKHNLTEIPINKTIYDMDSKSAFSQMYKITYPDGEYDYNNYDYLIATESLTDHGYHVFAVGNGENIRILGSKLIYNKELSTHLISDAEISEAVISATDMRSLLSSFISFLC